MGCIRNLNHLLIFTTTLSVILNICDMAGCTWGGIVRSSDHPIKQRGIAMTTLMYYATAPVYFVCLMYSLVGYNNLRHELCFHCKYGFFAIQTISVILVQFFLLESLPWKTMLVGFLLFCSIIFIRQLGIEERKQKFERNQQLIQERAQREKERAE